MNMKKQKPKAIVVGGSIAGESCAKALVSAGWDVVVIEKTRGPPTQNPTGAGLGLDPLAQKIVQSWLHEPELLYNNTLPITITENLATDGEKKISWVIGREEGAKYLTAYWADLHGLIYNTLPPEIFLWGHQYLSFCISEDKLTVKVRAKDLETDEIIEIVGDLLVGADGILSSIVQSILPDFKLRYTGYCAWRGSHILVTELKKEKFNWVWYVNQPEPELKGNTTSVKVSSDMIEELHQRAEQVWLPELSRLIKETKDPFLNAIYDRDPLEKIFWDRVVLTGDAAHPTTPHAARSTNMAITDAAVLGKCLEKWGPDHLYSALEEYQSIRKPVTSAQVLHSRRLGQMKQGLSIPGRERPFDPKTASLEDLEFIVNMKVPLFDVVPPILDSIFRSA
ncbi:FAD binding 3 domain-containing protein [Citrus sinensis]|nr:FAD binding 3 domain-containing protein [Citrus sinensis]